MMIQDLKILIVARSVVIKDKKILILKRCGSAGHDAGKWEFPGGKLDRQEDLFLALKREILEETGLQVELKDKVFHVGSEIISEGKYKDFTYIEICGIANIVGGQLKISEEHDDMAWVSFEEIKDYELKEEVELTLNEFSANILKAIDLS